MTNHMFQLTLYGRAGCHLCVDVEKRIHRVAEDIPLSLQIVDIESDMALVEKYMLTIPVVAIDGDEVFVSIRSVMSEAELRAELYRRIGEQSP